jgi:beta-glucosidase
VCIPCGSALGATWNPALVEQVGEMLGQETRTKACRVLLAPTVNIHRSPLAGRNFECYSEDPLLSGRIAAAFVRGVQSQGVSTTVKHFAGNDAEFERNSISSDIDERALREIYLLPFELAVREGGALGIMTGYNRVNGTWCAEHAELIDQILRREWGFEGFVVTDWYGVGSTVGSANAGLDLEMPGPGRIYGPALAAAVRANDVVEARLDDAVRHLLTVFDRLGALDEPPGDAAQDDRPEHRLLTRRAAAEATVLLKNDGALPLSSPTRHVAVIGPNADRAQIMGGGSASLSPHYRVTPLDAIRAALTDATVTYARGCDTDRTAQPLRLHFEVDFFAGLECLGDVLHHMTLADSRVILLGAPPDGVPSRDFSFRATCAYEPPESGEYTLTLVQAGRARVLVDGDVVVDGVTDPPGPGTEFFGMASAEVAGTATLTAGQPCRIDVEYSSEGSTFLHAVSVGCRLPQPPDLMDRAVAAAAAADVAVVVVGTNDEWESEGYDRASMNLPEAQDELIRRVAAANDRTVVVVNSGAPVTMDWADDVNALLQIWFGGQEMANALVDVLTGEREPGGRLPTTFPVRLEHNPSFGNFPGENGHVRYGESVLVGYRWYEARRLPTRFPFGHGLSYTSFEFGEPALSGTPGQTLTVEVAVTNTGSRRGSEVVQCYVAPRQPRLTRPPKELKAFAKVELDPGETRTVSLELSDRAFAYWDPGDPGWPERKERLAATVPFPTGTVDGPPASRRATEPGWRVDPGVYELHIGRSSADITHVREVEV